MKKITSTQTGSVIKFRATGTPGGAGSVYVIDNKGILVTDVHAQMMEERLGGQIAIAEAQEADLAAAQEQAQKDAEESALQEGMACKTEDGADGVLQKDENDQLVCVVPQD